MNSYKEENENLKKQMFMIDKSKRDLESSLMDEQDKSARNKRDCEKYKKRHADVHS